MRIWERSLLLALTLTVLSLLARVSLTPAALAADDDDRDHAIAVCAMPSLINELMASPRFLPARENPAPELRDEFEDLRRELDDLNQRLENAGENDPGAQRDVRRRREVFQQLQNLQGRIARAVEEKTAEQFAECYAMVRSSASAIAEDLGFDYVIATGDPDESLSTTISEVTLRQITARPVLRFPRGVDITDDVRDDLNLE
jgi:Skp family chaperone for outer membrane proteins